MQELYMMPFLLMILFIGIFAITTIGGRAWCGWACPQTIFRVIYRDLIEGKLLGLRRVKNKQKEPDWSKSSNKIKRIIAILIWFVLSVVAASDFMWYFIPPSDFFAYLNDMQNHMILVGFVIGIVVFLVYDIVFLKEDFCIYVCPYSRIQTVLYDDDTFQAIYSEKRGGKIYNGQEKIVLKQQDVPDGYDCTACQSCVTVCPTHIDIRKGMQLECINCLECVDACTTVMGKLGKESLIQWSSSNETINNKKVKFFRKKTIMYIIAILGIIIMLFVMGGKKEYMLLNVNKTTKLYSIKDNGKRVENTFVLLFQNTQKQPYTYDLEVIGEYAGKITIKKFIPFRLSRGKLAKKVVKLVTTQKLVNDNTKDTPVTVTLKAFAKEKPDKINVIRKAVFMYPRADKLK
jgi:cytochrome c oxidase accessory protein FixG